MYNPITETINPKEAVLFSCGGVNEVARQFAEMLQYCKRKKLHVVDIFADLIALLIKALLKTEIKFCANFCPRKPTLTWFLNIKLILSRTKLTTDRWGFLTGIHRAPCSSLHNRSASILNLHLSDIFWAFQSSLNNYKNIK